MIKYTHFRIKRILSNEYNYRLEEIWSGYKGNRVKAVASKEEVDKRNYLKNL